MKKENYSKEERAIWQQNITVLQVFITVTPNETGNATAAYFSGDLNKENLEEVSLNDIPSNSCRIKIAGKDPVACDLFFTNTLEILIEHMIGFDMKSKLPKQKRRPFWSPPGICWRY